MIMDAELIQLKKDADTGIEHRQGELAFRYYEGDGIKQDKRKAYKYYLLSAKQGYPLSCYELAGMYYDKGNFRKCAYWAEIAAENHEPMFEEYVELSTIKLMLAISYQHLEDHPKAWELYKELATTEDESISRVGKDSVKEYVGKVVRFRKNSEEGIEFLS